MSTPEVDRCLMMEDERHGQLATRLGGRAIEDIVFGKVSTGAKEILQVNRDLMDAITEILIGRESLEEETLEKLYDIDTLSS